MSSREVNPSASGGSIPFRILVGVTGHRKLDDTERLVERVREALEKIRGMVPFRPGTAVVLDILSPLAEGADRLVAREVLLSPSSELEVVLPLDRECYMTDFAAAGSKAEFLQLLSQARSVKELAPGGERTIAYERAGRYVVDHCDVLIAIWDGEPAAGKGGTAEIVEYARARKCPLLWISSAKDHEIVFEPGMGIDAAAFERLDSYNSEHLDRGAICRRRDTEFDRLNGLARASGLREETLRPIAEKLLPHFVRADILALRHQRLYYRAGSTIYLLAAGAVAVAAFQALFAPGIHGLAWLEVALIAAVLAVIAMGSRCRWHGRWIDYRFLAERLRSALFLALAGARIGRLSAPRQPSLAYSPRDWIVAAFNSVWCLLPGGKAGSSDSGVGLRQFLLAAWIEDQIRYHVATSRRHGRRYWRLALLGNILFVLTFVVAVLHTLPGMPAAGHSYLWFAAIVLPTFGGALGAVRTHREYRRNAKRSAEMARYLEDIAAKVRAVEDGSPLLELVQETEETMLRENEDWRVVVRFHELEPPA
jgi:hypothetical protein